MTDHEEGQGDQWDRVADGWRKWWPTIEAAARSVSERMLELARVQSGHQILDIATGIGEPALLAAFRVGETGRVVATDLSSRMLVIARERAATLKVMNVEFIEADAEHLAFPDGSFDAILCRWGVTSLPDPPKTLATIRRLLRPDGSFATAVWGPGSKSRPLASLAAAVAQEMFDPPSSPPESASSTSAEDTLELKMLHAGFTDVHIEEMTLTLEFRSAQDCIQYLKDVSPDFAELLGDKSPAVQAEYQQRLRARLGQYLAGDGWVRIPNVTTCAVGRR